MESRAPFPIRLKILLTLLVVVTAVVSVITYSMADMFHEDKKTYIHDLVSVTAMSAAEECHALLGGYRDRLRAQGRILSDGNLTRQQRESMLQTFFSEFEGLVALFVYEGSEEKTAVMDTASLEAAGLSGDALREHLAAEPLPLADLARTGPVTERRILSPALPVLAMAVPLDAAAGEPARSVVAVIRLDALARVARRSNVLEVFVVDGKGRLLAHRDPTRLRDGAVQELPAGAQGGGGAVRTLEYREGDVDMIGGFAGTGFGDIRVGVQVPRATAFLASRDLLDRLVTVALLLLVGAAVLGLIGSRTITRPVERLMAATRRVGKGEFGAKVDVKSRDEIGALADAFNEMARELRAREHQLQEAQRQLIQSEKMAAFGQIGAGVAHEVKNPLAGILGCAQLSLRSVEKGSRTQRNLQLIEKETKRCQQIVENLLRFARQEKAVLEPTDVDQVVTDAVSIVQHQLELHRVGLDVECEPDLPRVRGNSNQLQQVILNLMVNAQQVLAETGGTVTVRAVRNEQGQVEISVADDGPGIPEQHRSKIFEPFFTTKPNGQGTGLGLSVSYGIVKDHGGDILLDCPPEGGTKFTVRLDALDEPVARRMMQALAQLK